MAYVPRLIREEMAWSAREGQNPQWAEARRREAQIAKDVNLEAAAKFPVPEDVSNVTVAVEWSKSIMEYQQKRIEELRQERGVNELWQAAKR